MDYAFLPEGKKDDHYYMSLRALLRECRNNTDLASEHEKLWNIEDFVGYVVSRPERQRPIGDLLIGGHSGVNGPAKFSVDLDAEDMGDATEQISSETTPEELCNAIRRAEEGKPSVRLPQGVASGDSTLWLLTCYSGRDLTFLRLFRKAIGIPYVGAPKAFFHNAHAVAGGVFEWICPGYSMVRRPSSEEEWANPPFKKHEELKQAFVDAKFPVPDSKWADWISRDWADKPAFKVIRLDLGETVAGRTTLDAWVHFSPSLYEYNANVPVEGPIPTSWIAIRPLLRDYLASKREFQEDYCYPQYQWRGFSSLDEFLLGFFWKVTPKQSGGRNILQCTGRRRVYTVAPPLTRPDTEKTLLFNFYPKKSSGNPPIIHLPYTDANYFNTVGQ